MTRRIAAVILLVLASTPLLADSFDAEITKRILTEVGRNRMIGKALIASTTSGEVKPSLIDWALRVRTRPVAEEMVTNFRERNAEPVEIDPKATGPFGLIKLEDYTKNGAIEWERVAADFPGTRTIIEVSRAGRDKQDAFAVAQVRYHFMREAAAPESILFNMLKRPDNSWDVATARQETLAAWKAQDCTQSARDMHPDYTEVCRAFTGARAGS